MTAWESTWNALWHDFIDAKFGDEYLILLLERKRKLKQMFKFFTLFASAAGVISALIDAKVPTIVICVLIGVVQLISVIESTFIATEKELYDLCALRLLYCQYANDLEKIVTLMRLQKINSTEANTEINKCRSFKLEKIEPIDTEYGVDQIQRLKKVANEKTLKYLNRRYT